MSYTLELLPSEPILVATLHGELDAGEMRQMFLESARLTQHMPGPIYRITDSRQAHATFIDMLQTVRASSAGTPGASTDPKFKLIFVGTNELVRMGVDMLKQPQFGGVIIPFFREMNEAFAYIRNQIMKGQTIHDYDHSNL